MKMWMTLNSWARVPARNFLFLYLKQMVHYAQKLRPGKHFRALQIDDVLSSLTVYAVAGILNCAPEPEVPDMVLC